jgi:hypothetical protein
MKLTRDRGITSPLPPVCEGDMMVLTHDIFGQEMRHDTVMTQIAYKLIDRETFPSSSDFHGEIDMLAMGDVVIVIKICDRPDRYFFSFEKDVISTRGCDILSVMTPNGQISQVLRLMLTHDPRLQNRGVASDNDTGGESW